MIVIYIYINIWLGMIMIMVGQSVPRLFLLNHNALAIFGSDSGV